MKIILDRDTKLKVLIVDDEAQFTDMLAIYIQELGMYVDIAFNGKDGQLSEALSMSDGHMFKPFELEHLTAVIESFKFS